MNSQHRDIIAVPPQLHIDLVRRDEHTVVIKACGELDLCSAPRLAEALASAISTGCRDVALDLGGLSFCDAAGLQVMVDAYRRLSHLQRRLSVTQSSRAVRRVLDLAEAAYLLADGTVPADGSR